MTLTEAADLARQAPALATTSAGLQEAAEAEAVARARLAPVCAHPTTRAGLLELVEAWKVSDQVAIHRPPWPGQAPCMYVYDLAVARGHFVQGGWSNAHFRRVPELEAAARLFRRARDAANQVQELLDLVEPGGTWEPEGLTAAWAALHRVLREARPDLPSLGRLE